jgi:hypothetical protein
MSNEFDVNAAKKEAEKEIREERVASAKKKLKSKLKEISTAESILSNLNRELAELEVELQEGVE